ncbi:hypothetical protein [Actinoplanes sp. HUAS TT8]|uniref:hypothetical protein n=1 Tax=Actinoplanes sp. HUAS TT8 TaxID=3447453 RepID=UPI003F5211E4
MIRWRRPYPWTFMDIVGAIFTVVGTGFAIVLAVAVVTTAPRLEELSGVLAAAVFLAVWLTAVNRLTRAGIYLSDHGVRLRGVFRTRTFVRAEIAEAVSAPAELFGRPTARQAIWLVLRDGTRIEAPVQERTFYRSTPLTKNSGAVLAPSRFAETLTAVNQHVA